MMNTQLRCPNKVCEVVAIIVYSLRHTFYIQGIFIDMTSSERGRVFKAERWKRFRGQRAYRWQMGQPRAMMAAFKEGEQGIA